MKDLLSIQIDNLIETIAGRLTRKDCTIDSTGGDLMASDGYVVSLRGTELILPETRSHNINEIRPWVQTVWPKVAKCDSLNFGRWTDKGRVYFDLSIIVKDKDAALRLAKTEQQQAIYSLHNKEAIFVD